MDSASERAEAMRAREARIRERERERRGSAADLLLSLGLLVLAGAAWAMIAFVATMELWGAQLQGESAAPPWAGAFLLYLPVVVLVVTLIVVLVRGAMRQRTFGGALFGVGCAAASVVLGVLSLVFR